MRKPRLWRPLWWLEHDDVVAFCDGNGWRRSQLDRWLAANGLPTGDQLRGGSLCAVTDWRGRPWLCARTLTGRQLQVRLIEDPPERLPVRSVAGRAATGGAARPADDRS